MRLIDADALADASCSGGVCAECDDMHGGNNVVANCSEVRFHFLKLIKDAPTIRPDMAILMQENTNMRKILHKRCRRGTWVKIGAFLDGEKAQCSNCGYDIILNERLRNSFNFCPHCGADMRGGAVDE